MLRLPKLSLARSGVRDLQTERGPYRGRSKLALCLLLVLGVSSLRRTIMSLLEEQRTLIGSGIECIGRE